MSMQSMPFGGVFSSFNSLSLFPNQEIDGPSPYAEARKSFLEFMGEHVIGRMDRNALRDNGSRAGIINTVYKEYVRLKREQDFEGKGQQFQDALFEFPLGVRPDDTWKLRSITQLTECAKRLSHLADIREHRAVPDLTDLFVSDPLSAASLTKPLERLPLYRQTDPRWAHLSYGGKSTIRSSGCGPTSAAMLISAGGRNVLPPEVARFAMHRGLRVLNSGTSREIFSAAAHYYGVGKAVEMSTLHRIKNALSLGFPVAVLVHGLPFARGGHYIVLRGYQEGLFKINDPGPRKIGVSTEKDLERRFEGGWAIVPRGMSADALRA